MSRLHRSDTRPVSLLSPPSLMFSKYLLVAALALPLAACGGDEAGDTTVVDTTTDPMVTDPMVADPMATDPMAGGTMAGDVTVDGTIAAAGTDLTALAPAAAISNIDGWIAKLETAEFDQSDDLVEGLRELKTELGAMPFDGSAIGETLNDLGELTTASAATASSSSQEGLRTLGGALSATGARLSGGTMGAAAPAGGAMGTTPTP